MCELLKSLLVGIEEKLIVLLCDCVLLGVDEVVYIKVGFFIGIVKEEIISFLIIFIYVVELLGIMVGGYNV